MTTPRQAHILLSVLLFAAACGSGAATAPAPAGKQADAPAARSEPAPAPAGASPGACDVRLTAGSDAPAVEVVAGKTYCVGELRFTRDTDYKAAHASLGGACHEEALEGETRLECRGVELSFGGPVLVLSKIRTTRI